MSASDIIKIIASSSLGFLIVTMSIVQISPIKLNPWSYILKKIGNVMNDEVIKKVNKLDNDLSNLRKVCDEREANGCRTRILHFNDEMIHGANHTKEHFDQILIDISTYEKYCDSHSDYKNNIANFAISHIKTAYAKCSDEGTFI